MPIHRRCLAFSGLLLASGAFAQAPYDLKDALPLGGYFGESLAASDARLLYGSDFNNDGRADLVTKNRTTLTVYARQDDGSFVYFWHAGTAGFSAAVGSGNFNDDTLTDLVVGYPNALQIYTNNGNGSGLTAANGTVPLQSLGPRPMLNDLAVADFNGDAKTDVVALDTDPLNPGRTYPVGNGVIRHRESAALLWGRGAGVISPDSARPRIPAAEYPLRAHVVELSGDDRPEMISTNGGSMNLQYNPAGGFGSASTTLYVVAPATGIHGEILGLSTGNLNADTRRDVAVAYYTNDPLLTATGRAHLIKFYRNATHPQLPFALIADQPDIVLPYPANGLVIADFNGDTVMDLIVALESAGTASVALYAGRGNFTFDPPVYINGGFSAGEIVVGHFNTDSRLDIAVVDIDNNRVVTYLHR